jgi:hypothetical protein
MAELTTVEAAILAVLEATEGPLEPDELVRRVEAVLAQVTDELEPSGSA